MADSTDRNASSAEEAYAAAAAEVKPATTPTAPAPAEPVVEKAAAPRKVAPKKIEKPAAPQPAAKTAHTKATKRAARVARRAAVPAPVKTVSPRHTVAELKEKIMATAKTADFAKPMTDAIGEFQTRAKAAYEKSTETVAEMTEFAKGNVEAFVESGKILAGGAQDLGKTYVEEAKSAYETLTGDLKEMAAVKSPTELFQLQGKIMRRNFDTLIATGSKNTEAVMKLANDAFAPLSSRVSLAAEKLSKVA